MAKILIVEDDELIRQALSEAVKNFGYMALPVVSVDEAEAQLADPELVLILLDVMLPGKDGITWFNELQKSGNTIPVIFMSNLDRDEPIAMAAVMGARRYLVKANTDLKTLREAIEQVLGPANQPV